MEKEIKGLCEPNKPGILKNYLLYPHIPALKRYRKYILNNQDFKIQYGNALNLYSTTEIPLYEIIKVS